MDYKSLKTLEYHKIIEKLSSYAGSETARKMCADLKPMTDINSINDALTQTSDALSRIYAKGSVSFSGVTNIIDSIKRLEVGSTLNTHELLNISAVLTTAAAAKSHYEETNDSLTDYFNSLEPLTPLNTQIKNCIISEEEISDDASGTLRDIRRQMRISADRIHTELNKILNSPSTRSCLQDYVITMRQGRYCLPVKAEYKSQIAGMIHDQSATGSKIFIEPAAGR